MIDTAVILLVHDRISFLANTIKMINEQTNKNFTFFISVCEEKNSDLLQKIVLDNIDKGIDYKIESSAECRPWRRFTLSKDLANLGYKKIIFIDDDIFFPKNHVEHLLSIYEPQSYKSWWAWKITDPQNYLKKRVRVLQQDVNASYCGTGISIVDSSIFLQDGFFDVTEEAKWMDDIWISFFCNKKVWKVCAFSLNGISFNKEADSSKALYKNIKSKSGMSKDQYVFWLYSKYGWNI